MKPFSLLIKPVSFDCNLRCRYCFYLKKEELFGRQHPRMTDDTLQQMIRSYLAMDLPVYGFAWQGGEPTLAGLEFYRKAITYMQEFGRKGCVISNGLQTNGTLLDDAWCRFLKQYNFLVGISVDGPEKLHNAGRQYADTRGSHAAVLRGISMMNRYKVDYNVLTLVSSSNMDQPETVYRYLRDNLHVRFHQYVECVEFDADGRLRDFSVTPEKWGEFMCRIFDLWYPKDVRRVSIRLFDAILDKMINGEISCCPLANDCRHYLVVERDGGIFPCDFFVESEWQLGDVATVNWQQILRSEKYRDFGHRKSQLPEDCLRCEYYAICAGCCQKNRIGRGSEPNRKSVLCEGWKQFYAHTLDRFRELARQIVSGNR